MSDFGANIFDDSPAPTQPEAPARQAKPASEPPEPAAREARERRRERAADEARELVEVQRAPTPANPWQDVTDADERREHAAPRDDRRPPREPREPREPRHEDRGRREEHRDRRDEHRQRRDEHRGRREEHRGRRDERREERREHGPRDGAPRADAQRAAPAAPRAAVPAADRVVLLIDLDALRVGANTRNVELSWNRLQRGLSRGRTVVAATAFGAATRKVPAGFTLLAAGGDFAAGVELAAAAFAGAADGASVLLAPVTPALAVLARALRGHGRTVELVDFEAGEASGMAVVPLGKDCVFVP
ncbi:MAG: hypothetical protein H6835_06895 [Planctomycetes bacterium]|nr:hypothetical protein [Planctomycetota bacterium]